MRLVAFVFGGMAALFAILACGGLERADAFFRRPRTPEARAALRTRHRGARLLFAALALVSGWQCVDSVRLAAGWG
ncbi:hypothetical protein ACFZCF_05410 [Streptomyces sp. NPDC007945]|uniref:hypothetical protein n=1 Tax=Streptomyces sp. NPDC007945 TaxID=3364797 RepID=UPI0036E7AF01